MVEIEPSIHVDEARQHPACNLPLMKSAAVRADSETLKIFPVAIVLGAAAAGRGNDDMSVTRYESFEDFDANVSGTRAFADARGK